MAKYSLEQLKMMGAPVAKKHGVSMLIASNDGQFFFEHSRNAASLHQRTKPGIELYDIHYKEEEIRIEGVIEPEMVITAPVKLPADQAKAEIEKMTSIAMVENYLKGESRKTVLEAGKAKMKKLKTEEIAVDHANGRK